MLLLFWRPRRMRPTIFSDPTVPNSISRDVSYYMSCEPLLGVC